ncbi:hypothetical protein [Bradyrhizobium cosmicum]|uniref:Uncharacterized protein n=1 Tax=Bradyrhizobium cosmicum TaxID=1404864 RepID=A0AAI8MFI4_9BRAD|nr:hypothetical protein [Bradyrhizobium cosmicum]BAL77112.1 hypothetical protein S23_39170 [Bradyrhizobium cosmicum]
MTGINQPECSTSAMTVAVAYILLEDARLPNERALIETLRVRHPGLRWDSFPAAASNDIDGPMFIRVDDHLMTILLMPAPMPYDQQMWQRASWVWPEAFHAAGRHRAHLVVSTMGSAENIAETKALGFAENARLTTAVVGAVLEALPGCLGVVWGGQVAHSPEEWLRQSPRAFDPFPNHPYSLWMEIVHYLSGKTIGAYTTGLSAFIGLEIEFEVDGLDQRGVTVRVADASSYLIANGLDKHLKSGTVYTDDDENVGRVAVLHRSSRFGIGPVVSFFSLHDRAGRLKTYPIIPATISRHHPLLVMLSKVGLFDPTKDENQIELRPDHYVSEVRLDSLDNGLTGELSKILATDGYAEADTNARRALASGDTASARSFLLPWAEKVGRLQLAVQVALSLCDAFMFMPAPPRSP